MRSRTYRLDTNANNDDLAPSASMAQRPRTRAECPDARPCPWAGCRYHLAVEVSVSGRSLRVREGWELELDETCALDVADAAALEEEGTHLSRVALLMGLDYRVAQDVERNALAQLAMRSDVRDIYAAQRARHGRSSDVGSADPAEGDWNPDHGQEA